MQYAFAIAGVLALLFVAFVAWRYTSVARGGRQRDERILQLLNPIGEKLANGQLPSLEEIEQAANQPFARPLLYGALKHFERLELFPTQFTTPEAQAEAELVYWMLHPNELEESPARIEFVERVTRELGGESCDFYVFRYLMAEGHWAAKDGWLLGLAGPFIENDVPYSGAASAFCRGSDKHGEVEPAELVDWYIDVAGLNRA